MQTLTLQQQDNYAIVTLDRGRSNPMNMQLVQELRATIKEIDANPQLQGAILSGKENFFSAGLDVIELYDYDQTTMTNFWRELVGLITELSCSPKIWIAAITGHSPAGGCVLALCCDRRVMAAGKYKIGLNEVPVGIVIPAPIYHLYAHVLGERLAYQYLLEGRLLLPDEALAAGLVDTVVAAEEVLPESKRQLERFLKLNPKAVQQSKANMRQPLYQRLTTDFDSTFGATLAHWWQPESRQALAAMVAGLKQK